MIQKGNMIEREKGGGKENLGSREARGRNNSNNRIANDSSSCKCDVFSSSLLANECSFTLPFL